MKQRVIEALGIFKGQAKGSGGAGADKLDLDVTRVHEAHADFVFRSLLRLGVREADVEDMMQEVFVVVHRKQATYDPATQLTTWLFGICLRVAAAYRRRAYNRRERLVEEAPERGGPSEERSQQPDALAETKQARQRLDAILDELDVERRAIFVMFEIDEMSCEEIGSVLGIAVGTVYSRLHAARKAFAAALARVHSREAHAVVGSAMDRRRRG